MVWLNVRNVAAIRSACRSFSSSRLVFDSLQGSTGEYSRHLVLFTGRKYDSIPSHVDSVSPIYRQLAERIKDPNSPLRSYALALTDSSAKHTTPATQQWNPATIRFEKPSTKGDSQREQYGIVIYPDRLQVPFEVTEESISTGQLEDFCHTIPPRQISNSTKDKTEQAETLRQDLDIFVCTHRQRDCRCGDVGSAFYSALIRELRKRQLGNEATEFDQGSGPIRVHRTTHIGGHRFAATCFTSAGDWYGLLASTDAKVFVDHLAKQGAAGSSDRDIWWAKWRGRTGFTSSAQLALAEKGVALQNVQAVDPPALALASSLRKKAKDRQAPLGNALDVPFVTYEGDTVTVRGFEGETLMDVAKRQELVEATCGGACECATCHVHLRPASGSEMPPLPRTTDEEEDQLEYAISTDSSSRLACQIPITQDLVKWFQSGGVVHLPRY